jgi:hypothetical protein
VPRLEVLVGDLDRSPRESAWIELSIGVAGERGSNIFAVHVGTPEAVLEYQQLVSKRATEALVLVREWSWPEVERTLRDMVARCDAGVWSMSVDLLERRFHHEFRDYDEIPDRLPIVPMIKARRANVHLQTWEPLDDAHVYLEIELTIGIRKHRDDLECLVTVATPAGLRANRSGFVLADEAVLLVSEYHWDTIEAELEAIVAGCRGTDWAHCRRKLERHFATLRP